MESPSLPLVQTPPLLNVDSIKDFFPDFIFYPFLNNSSPFAKFPSASPALAKLPPFLGN